MYGDMQTCHRTRHDTLANKGPEEHTRTRTQTHAGLRTQARTYTLMHADTHKLTHAHACLCTRTHIYTHTQIHTYCTHPCTRTHTRIHAFASAHTHTYTHAYKQKTEHTRPHTQHTKVTAALYCLHHSPYPPTAAPSIHHTGLHKLAANHGLDAFRRGSWEKPRRASAFIRERAGSRGQNSHHRSRSPARSPSPGPLFCKNRGSRNPFPFSRPYRDG